MKSSSKRVASIALASTLLLAIAVPLTVYASDKFNKADASRLSKGLPVTTSETKTDGHKRVKTTIFIKASPRVVWETVHEERKHDPDLEYSKVLEQGKNHAILEQKFVLVPIIGTAVCKMHNNEIPLERIDYHLIESDHFKAFEGSWVLIPTPDNNGTMLELSSYLDVGLPIPRFLIDGTTTRKLEKRLTNVKNMAEAAQLKVAEKNNEANK